MKKDYKRILVDVYLPRPGQPGITTVPRMSFLMVSGAGRPEDAEFGHAAQTLFPVAYAARFVLKESRPEEDYVIMPMEVKWRLDRSARGSRRYGWTMMLMQPESITKEIVEESIRRLAGRKKTPVLVDRLRVRGYTAGLCGQILHVGPYGQPMERTFDALKRYLVDQGYDWEPDSLDVYYNDARRCAQHRLRTLTRVRIWKRDGPPPVFDDPYSASA